MPSVAVVGCSVLLNLAAFLVAARSLRMTEARRAWSLLAIALLFITVHQAVVLAGLAGDGTLSGFLGGPPAAPMDVIALVFSTLMLLGVTLSRPIAVTSEESARRDAQAMSAAIFDNSVDTYYRTDLDGALTLASRSAKELIGYEVEELLGRRLADFYEDPEDRQRFLEMLEASGGRITGYEARLRHRNGDRVIVATSASFVRDPDGHIVGVEGIARDITEQKRAMALSTRLGRIIEDSVNEVFVFDAQTLRFLMVNRSARENLGYSMAELSAMTPLDIMPHQDERHFATLLAPLLAAGKPAITRESEHQRKDGTRYDVEIRLQFDGLDDPPVFFAIIEDITERRRVESSLRQAQKMEAIGQLTGGVAHDFNNLLAIIQGNAEILADQRSAKPHSADAILRASARGTELTQRLLAFSRRQPLRPRPIRLDSVVSRMSALLSRALGTTIEIVSTADPDLWIASADPGQVENALLNLAINARDAMPSGGRLSIECTNARLDEAFVARNPDASEGDFVVLSVTDSGTGMAQDVQERALEPFFTTKPVGQGSGLGLSMIYGFAKQSGGHLAIESETARGTRVQLYLPRAAETAELDGAETGDPVARGQGERILVIEDDEDVRAVTTEMLESLGYEVVSVPTASEALALLQGGSVVSLVLSDVVLPGGMSGPDFAVTAREQHPRLPIVFMSGYLAEMGSREDVIGTDAVLLTKPFRRKELAAAVRQLLG